MDEGGDDGATSRPAAQRVGGAGCIQSVAAGGRSRLHSISCSPAMIGQIRLGFSGAIHLYWFPPPFSCDFSDSYLDNL